MEWDISKGNFPCWYELSLNKAGIIWKIYGGLGDYWQNLKGFKEETYGFNNLGKTKDGFWNYLMEIPNNEKEALGAAIDIRRLTMFLYNVNGNKEISVPFEQLITIITFIENGYSIKGKIGYPLREWLRKKMFISEVIEAMKMAYQKMSASYEYQESDFAINIWGDGAFFMRCPGDNCGLNSEELFYRDKTKGYEFTSNNIVSPKQQITFIAGLAALHDNARKEMKI